MAIMISSTLDPGASATRVLSAPSPKTPRAGASSWWPSDTGWVSHAGRTSSAANRPGRCGIGPEQVAEVVGHAAFEVALDEAADRCHVLRRHPDILPAGNREDGDVDTGQCRPRVVGEEVAQPAGVDPEARDPAAPRSRMTSCADALMRATRLRWEPERRAGVGAPVIHPFA
jgi:hypothetical protein